MYLDIKRNAELNIQLRYKVYMEHHEQYKLINMIKRKYGHEPQPYYLFHNEEPKNKIEMITKEELLLEYERKEKLIEKRKYESQFEFEYYTESDINTNTNTNTNSDSTSTSTSTSTSNSDSISNSISTSNTKIKNTKNTKSKNPKSKILIKIQN